MFRSNVVIGGNVGAEPWVAEEIVLGLDDAEVLQVVDKLVQSVNRDFVNGQDSAFGIDKIGGMRSLLPVQKIMIDIAHLNC